MEFTTIKLDDNEYFTKNHLPAGKDIFFLSGARGSGKSYMVKHLVAEEVKKGNMFMYVRISDKELKTGLSWLNELDTFSDGELQRGKPYAGAITFTINDADPDDPPNIIGHLASLETSARDKSGVYDKTTIIVFEEYSRKNLTYQQEYDAAVNFVELIETIARFRDVKVFCITNSFKGISPLENIFIDADNACKIRIFNKRSPDKGILRGVSDSFREYLEGEMLDNEYVKLIDYAPLITIPWKDGHITLHYHLHDTSKYAFSNTKSSVKPQIGFNVRLWMLPNYKIGFSNYKTEKIVRRDFQAIYNKILAAYRQRYNQIIAAQRRSVADKPRKVI